MILERQAILVVALGLAVCCFGIFGNVKPIPLRAGNKRIFNLDIQVLVVFIYLLLVAVLIRDSYDIFFYRSAYDERVSHGKEILFDSVSFLLKDIGVSFDGFLFLWNTAVMILLFTGIRKYTGDVAAVAALTILAPFTLYITQMRNSMVSVILLNFFPLLFTGRKKDRWIYALVVLLCAQIHIIAYGYLIFLLLKRKETRAFRSKYFLVVGIITLMAVAFSAAPAVSLNSLIMRLPIPSAISSRLLAYIGGEKTPIKAAIFLVIKHLFFYLFTDRACLLQMRERSLSEGDRKKYAIIREMNTMMLLFLPVAIVNASFERVFNCFIIIQYAMVFNVRKQKAGLSGKRATNLSMQFILLVVMIIFTAISVHSNPEDLSRLLNSIAI